MRNAAAVVSMGMSSVWESTAMLRLLGGTQGAWAPTGDGDGQGHIVSPCTQLVSPKQQCQNTEGKSYYMPWTF